MMEPGQPQLLAIPEQPNREAATAERGGKPKLKAVDREQMMLAHICVDELIPADHKARAMWELAGRMDLGRFEATLKTRQGEAGRAAWDPRLLVSVWVYAYSEGIGSAREIERIMEWEPGLQWLCGLDKINHHTLSDFRVEHQEALDGLFRQMLALLQSEGLISLERVMHDGTKIRAQAGADTFRREKTLREHLRDAEQVVAAMGDPRVEAPERDRRQAARERAGRERKERLEKALEEWKVLTAEVDGDPEKQAVRVSETEPEARRMKHGDNAIAPSYNAQITTEASHGIIVGAQLSQSSSDAQSLMPALAEVEENLGKPAQVVVDGGFTNRDNIVGCAERQVDLIGSLPDAEERSRAAMKAQGIDPAFAPGAFRILEGERRLECPGGCVLSYVGQSRKREDQYRQFRARGEDCRACRFQPQCCPRKSEEGRTVSIRVEERAEVAAFRQKMRQAESQAIYRLRGAVAEFPNAWIKDKLGLRKFHVRGFLKAGTELVWACLTYNMMQWARLSWVRT